LNEDQLRSDHSNQL